VCDNNNDRRFIFLPFSQNCVVGVGNGVYGGTGALTWCV